MKTSVEKGGKSSLELGHLGHCWCPWDLFRSSEVSSDAKEREWGAKSKGKPPHLFIPSKTGTLVPEFVVEDQPFGELQPWCLRLQ